MALTGLLDPLTVTRSWLARRGVTVDPASGRASQPEPGERSVVDWRVYQRLTERQPLQQPDSTTCGSCCLVMARMINDPVFAMTIGDLSIGPVATGPTALDDPGAGAVAAEQSTVRAFDAAVLQMHRHTGVVRDSRGRWGAPWPRFLGTQPWAAARQMSGPGGSGRFSRTYRARILDPGNGDAAYRQIVHAVDRGEVVPLYVGDAFMARHIVLVTGHHPIRADGDVPANGDVRSDGLDVYEPTAGRWVDLPRERFGGGGLAVAGWDQAWFAVLPAG